jgi:amidase
MTRRTAIQQTALTLASSHLNAAAASPLCFTSARQLAAMLKARKLSARELLDVHLKQIAMVNPKVNAVVTLVEEQARAQAARCDEAAARRRSLGVLHGLPVVHKDLQDTKGIRTTYGSPLFKDHVPEQDTLLIERIKAAGAVTMGKTNTPEFGAGSQTFNRVFGATKNPHNLSRTCGGSSGGAAVALACGMAPIADGSDTGGSLRNPAAFCGVVGFRTSPGRVPRYPTSSGWSTISVVGPMARNVADTAFFLSAMAGPDERAPLSIHEPGARFLQPLERSFRGVRVAWFKDLGGLPFDRRVREVIQSRRKIFESLGCAVEEAEPDFSGAEEAFRVARALSFYQQHAAKAAQHRDQIKATVLEEVDLGARLTGPEICKAETARSQLYQRAGQFFSRYEFFVLPTTQVPAFDLTTEWVKEIEGVTFTSYIDWMRSCWYISVLHNPAISVPAGLTGDGLPVGLQIVGRHHDDWGVLQLAHAFEQELRLPQTLPAGIG